MLFSLILYLVIKYDFTASRWSPCSWSTSPNSSSEMTLPLVASFLRRTESVSLAWAAVSPCTVVMLLRPLRFWMLSKRIERARGGGGSEKIKVSQGGGRNERKHS